METHICIIPSYFCAGFPGGKVVNNLPANAGDSGLISGSVRSPGVGNDKMATHSSILAWELPGTEKPGEITKGQTQLSTHARTHIHLIFMLLMNTFPLLNNFQERPRRDTSQK